MIKVVLFDLDDTLFDHGRAVADGIVAYTGNADAGARWHALEEEHYHRYLAGELDYLGQRRARARGFAGADLTDAEADHFFAGYHAEYVAAWQLHDDAIACLDALASFRLGLITNGDPVFQGRKIEGLGLTARFEHIVASGSLGFVKPDPRIFLHACDLFGVAPAEALYVGDRLQTDAVGAAAAGLTGVWLARGGAPGGPGASGASGVSGVSGAELAAGSELARAEAPGVLVISSLAALPALVAEL